ncbi:hypothetical protein OSB04_014622 [Centaurea solstitialis]|uniref:Uncharacterized protein n=1 Tax=Centaurea solstitialis TaxID=347529 RepID=A0AA38W868_9ASTR|nr:hypothetical protein OSB04_014622 [Centaurea solstitialis]
MDFRSGNPRKHEWIPMDCNDSKSVNACKDLNEDLRINCALAMARSSAGNWWGHSLPKIELA